MKKRTRNLIFGIGLTLLSVGLVSGCTQNFCSDEDKARIMFAIDPGVSTFLDNTNKQTYINDNAERKNNDTNGYVEYKPFADNENFYQVVEWDEGGNYFQSKNGIVKDNKSAIELKKAHAQNSVIKSTRDTITKNGGYLPSLDYYVEFDKLVLLHAMEVYNQTHVDDKVETATITSAQATAVLNEVGVIKYNGRFHDEKAKLLDSYYFIHNEVVRVIGIEKSASTNYIESYKSTMNSQVNNLRSCIVAFNKDGAKYGNYGAYNSTIEVSQKSWKYAWSKGFFEGILVYPVSWMLDGFVNLFGGVKEVALPQLGALIVVTIIMRLLIFALTFPSTIQQQKMQALQPELAKIQAKYPNSNTNNAERQRLAQEQQALYKKNKVFPLLQLLVMVVQFPVFICVWGAMTGSAALSTGSILGLHLSSSIMSVLTNLANWPKNGAWWTALGLFVLMAVSQFLSMKLPQWVQKAKAKKVARLSKNPAQNQQNRTMNIVSYVMLAVIIFMGFSLPAAMGVYWFIGALVSLAQSFITQGIMAIANNAKKKQKHKK